VYNLSSASQTVQYLHAAAGFLAVETWIKAIKAGNFITWLILTLNTVRRHFPESDETQKGHMKQQCQGVRSTRVQEDTEPNVPAIPKKRSRNMQHNGHDAQQSAIRQQYVSQQHQAKGTNM
jgi:hypothetical protein